MPDQDIKHVPGPVPGNSGGRQNAAEAPLTAGTAIPDDFCPSVDSVSCLSLARPGCDGS